MFFLTKECLKYSEWKLEDIYAVEVVGGSTRIPFIKVRAPFLSLLFVPQVEL